MQQERPHRRPFSLEYISGQSRVFSAVSFPHLPPFRLLFISPPKPLLLLPPHISARLPFGIHDSMPPKKKYTRPPRPTRTVKSSTEPPDVQAPTVSQAIAPVGENNTRLRRSASTVSSSMGPPDVPAPSVSQDRAPTNKNNTRSQRSTRTVDSLVGPPDVQAHHVQQSGAPISELTGPPNGPATARPPRPDTLVNEHKEDTTRLAPTNTPNEPTNVSVKAGASLAGSKTLVDTPTKGVRTFSPAFIDNPLRSKREDLRHDLSAVAREIPYEFFLNKILPPLREGISLTQVVRNLTRNGTIKDKRFTTFQQLPKDAKDMDENEVFTKWFQKLVRDITEAATTDGIAPTLAFFHNGNQVPQSYIKKGNKTRPDSFAIRVESVGQPLFWINIGLCGEVKKKNTDGTREDVSLSVTFPCMY